MLEELGGQRFVDAVLFGQFERYAHQVETERAHPTSGIGLFELGPVRQLVAAVKHGDVIEAKKAALENIISFAVDLIHPPGKVDQQFVKTLFEKLAVRLPRTNPIHVVNAPNSPGMNRRIEIGKLPL